MKKLALTREQILAVAETGNVTGLISVLQERKIDFDILDQEDMFDITNGCVNMVVDGMPEGEALLFFDGKLS